MSWNLQKWPVLQHLTFAQLCDISHLVVYGDKGPSDYGTALYITKRGLVYATGVNSYCGRYYDEKTEIIKGGGRFLTGSVLVEDLSSLGLKQIVQGCGFGIGQTSSNDLYLWGNMSSSIMLRKHYMVIYECFKPDSVCEKCTVSFYSPSNIGGFTLNRCEGCDWYPTRGLGSHYNPETPVKIFMEFCDTVVVLCSNCRQWCSFLPVGDHDLYYCLPCNILQESTGWCEESSSPSKIELNESINVVEVACGESFFVVRTASNNLLLYGYMGYWFQGYLDNPDDAIIQSVSCGGSHTAVTTDKDELYTTGIGSSGQLGYKWDEAMSLTTLRKVPIPGAVLKVCCGKSSTACLLSDGTIQFFGGRKYGNKSPLIHVLNQHTFTGIACATLTDVFSAKTIFSEVFFWRSPSPNLHLKVDACHDSIDGLVGWPVTYNSAAPQMEFWGQTGPCVQHGSSHYASYYRQKRFSDLTLRLKDEDFPVHRMILYSNSVYFKHLLSKSKDIEVLDMANHDPGTYRNLLKCFYHALMKNLDWSELFDLHLLAKSYNESDIVKESSVKLRLKVNNRNVELIAEKAKANGLKWLLDYCERKRISSR